MKQTLLPFTCFFILLIFLFAAFQKPALAQVDPNASDMTLALYANLKKIQNSNQFMFGQEFFNSFQYISGAAHGQKDYSDSKAVCGSHPAVLGSDFHYYLEKNASERAFHTEAVKWAYQQGCVITFDWHISGRGTTTYEYTETTKNLVNNIVQNLNGDKEWFLAELDKVIDIINNDLIVNGERVPVVFRPWHEMNGNWFWWGSRSTTVDNYKALFRITVDYMKERTNSVLFCWSPNEPVNMNYYPGDDWVDILGFDYYEMDATKFRTQMGIIVDKARASDKVAVLSETGNRTNSDQAGLYWENTVLPAIVNDPSGKAQKIAWVLTWINASWSFPYSPHSTSGTAVKQSFTGFMNSTNVLFATELPDMYDPPAPVSIGNIPSKEKQILLSYNTDLVVVKLAGFHTSAIITIYDITGRIVLSFQVAEQDTIMTRSLKPGLYLLRASDGINTASERLLIR